MDKLDHIVYGLDDANPNTMEEATRRRKKLVSRIEAKLTIMAVSTMVIAGIVAARFVLDVILNHY